MGPPSRELPLHPAASSRLRAAGSGSAVASRPRCPFPCSGLIPRLLGDILSLWLCNMLAYLINTYALENGVRALRPARRGRGGLGGTRGWWQGTGDNQGGSTRVEGAFSPAAGLHHGRDEELLAGGHWSECGVCWGGRAQGWGEEAENLSDLPFPAESGCSPDPACAGAGERSRDPPWRSCVTLHRACGEQGGVAGGRLGRGGSGTPPTCPAVPAVLRQHADLPLRAGLQPDGRQQLRVSLSPAPGVTPAPSAPRHLPEVPSPAPPQHKPAAGWGVSAEGLFWGLAAGMGLPQLKITPGGSPPPSRPQAGRGAPPLRAHLFVVAGLLEAAAPRGESPVPGSCWGAAPGRGAASTHPTVTVSLFSRAT